MISDVLFWIFATLILVTAGLVALRPRPIEGAMWLILNFFFTAGLYVLLGAHFVAVIQVLVYAGAIMVLFVFVIMLLNLDPRELGADESVGLTRSGLVLFVAFLTFVLLSLKLTTPLLLERLPALPEQSQFGSLDALARVLLTKYVFGFEVAGIILLLAIIGVGLLAYRAPRAPVTPTTTLEKK